MTPSQQDATFKPPQYPDLESTIVLPKRRTQSPAVSASSLRHRGSNASLSSLFASTSTLPAGYSSSGTATPTGSVVPGSVFSPGSRQNGTQSPAHPPTDKHDDPRNLIFRSFVPHVAVLASSDTEEIVRGKGFEGGLLELLRPFGESVPGKVTIRDSVGASRSWEDFGIRFTGLFDGLQAPRRSTDSKSEKPNGQERKQRVPRVGGDVAQIEEAVERHLQYSEMQSNDLVTDYLNHKEMPPSESSTSPFYTLFLRRLLSGLPMQPHETFSHPVACVIAVSSRHPDPVEEIRRLYALQHHGDMRLPQWVNNDFLRYYLLIHDEEEGDITKSNSLFEQMKRHFGLHCHLLRLKSNHCIPSDDDSVPLPLCQWISAGEELAEIQKREATEDITDPTPYLFDSDVTAVRTFVRELVVQSVLPWMERTVAQWQEQVLARRRGISGRFMSLSKRWTPFGSSRNSSSSTSSSSSSNYDSVQGFYRPDTPEALMRKLADFAFMLRDFKLALQTYDLLRSDFNNDKAWRYYAGAAEMAVVSALMTTSPLSSKTRMDNLDAWIEAASYSYLSRANTPYHALRSMVLSLELLRLRGASATNDAARWASKILETGLVGNVGEGLFTERVSACYASRVGVGSMNLGSRRRKAALWSVLAARRWLENGKALQAEKSLDAACRLYGIRDTSARLPFGDMQIFMDNLRQDIFNLRLANRGFDDQDEEHQEDQEDLLVEEVSETLDASPKLHRKSLIGATAPQLGIDLPLSSPTKERHEIIDDQFE